jgi:Lysozyme like domain
MAKLNEFQIAGYALAAGFPPNEIATATAVALAESGGNTEAQNRNTNGSYDYGLFQINTIHGPLLNQGDKFNPLDNAKMALAVWQRAGNKWTPWTVYKSGTYRAQILKGTAGAAKPATVGAAPATGFQPPLVSPDGEPMPIDPNTGGVAIPGQGGPLDAALGMFGTMAQALSGLNTTLMGLVSGGFWLRIGAFVVGALLIGISLLKLSGAEKLVGAAVTKKLPV